MPMARGLRENRNEVGGSEMKKLMGRLTKKLRYVVNGKFRPGINARNRKKLNNEKITLIASNCNGCLMLHDLGVKFQSPFVNLFIRAEDFLRLLQNFDYYMSLELDFPENQTLEYPVAYLGDIRLDCVHYATKEEVVEKWNVRKARMDMSNCFIMFTDRDGCSEEHLRAFDALPFERKVVFTHKPYPKIQSACYSPGFEKQGCVGNLNHYRGWFGEKYFDTFDYVSWFNGEM